MSEIEDKPLGSGKECTCSFLFINLFNLYFFDNNNDKEIYFTSNLTVYIKLYINICQLSCTSQIDKPGNQDSILIISCFDRYKRGINIKQKF